MVKTLDLLVAVLLVCLFFMPIEVYGMGWLEPILERGGGGGGSEEPVSASEPGVITLIFMVLSGGAGYFLGKRKK